MAGGNPASNCDQFEAKTTSAGKFNLSSKQCLAILDWQFLTVSFNDLVMVAFFPKRFHYSVIAETFNDK